MENRATQVGISDPSGTPAAVFANMVELGPVTSVLLVKDYQMLCLPGQPSRPEFLGTAERQSPETLLSGRTVAFYANEAAGIVAVGGGEYA